MLWINKSKEILILAAWLKFRRKFRCSLLSHIRIQSIISWKYGLVIQNKLCCEQLDIIAKRNWASFELKESICLSKIYSIFCQYQYMDVSGFFGYNYLTALPTEFVSLSSLKAHSGRFALKNKNSAQHLNLVCNVQQATSAFRSMFLQLLASDKAFATK